jgi:hypothetical protein
VVCLRVMKDCFLFLRLAIGNENATQTRRGISCDVCTRRGTKDHFIITRAL